MRSPQPNINKQRSPLHLSTKKVIAPIKYQQTEIAHSSPHKKAIATNQISNQRSPLHFPHKVIAPQTISNIN
ncbi:MAG: hypothetical protein ACK5VA_10825 [Pseudanabaena sp.]|jgi:hypothetical protein|nr:hypothetical protein [Pseudanabaena sp. 42896M_M3]